MYKLLIYITTIGMIVMNGAFANIHTIKNLSHFEEILKDINRDTLMIFDVDHVLIMSTDDYTIHRHPYRQVLWDEIIIKKSTQEIKFLKSIVITASTHCLVDPKILNILSWLKKNLVPTVALTFYATGEFGIIKSLEDWRIKELHNMGINFTDSSPFKDTTLSELKNNNGTPTVKNGIIFTAELDKALVLENILNNGKYHPKNIIFIDDKLQHLQSIEKLCAKSNINFSGFHYVAVSQKPLPILDKKKEKLRFHILEKEHRWLSLNDVYSIQH